MGLDSHKELTAVFYSPYAAKVIPNFKFAPNSMAFPLHWHDRLELLRIRKGSLTLSCANTQVLLQPDDIALISPKLLHSGTAGDDGAVYDVLTFDLNALLNETGPAAQYIQPLCEGKYIFEPLVQNRLILDRLDSIVAAHQQSSPHHPLQVVGEFYDLLGLLYKNCVIRDMAALPTQKHFDRAIDYINEHYSEKITLETISKNFHLNPSYISRTLKNKLNISYEKYLK